LGFTGAAFSTTDGVFQTQTEALIYSGSVNEAQYSILAQMTKLTLDPALALQAFLTNLCAITYYNRIVMFDTAAPSTQVSLVQVIRPLGWAAYTVVVGVVVAHLLLVVVVAVIFGRAGKLSRIGSAWTGISQLLGPTTDTWIRDADMANDEAVKSWLGVYGLHRTMVQVGNMDGHAQLVQKST
jgi:hypothetical protein